MLRSVSGSGTQRSFALFIPQPDLCMLCADIKIANCKKDAIFSVASFDFYGNYHLTNSKNIVRRLGCAR